MSELPKGRTVIFGNQEFSFSLASTGLELMRGLGGVTSLDPYDGMLFDFGHNFHVQMCPRGLKFDIEVAFLTSEGEVVQFGSISADDDPSFFIEANMPVRYVLEVPVGFFEEHNISIGDTFTL